MKTYAKPDIEWDGFRPRSYGLNFEKIWNLPVSVADGDSEGNAPLRSMTIGELLRSVREGRVLGDSSQEQNLAPIPRLLEGLDVALHGLPSFNHSLAKVLLEMEREGIHYLETRWFWYDRDSATSDAMERYTFFVVHDNAIIREQVSFSDHSSSGFDPTVFEASSDSRPIWFNEREFDAALDRLFYQKFYTETFMGRLMVLRPDEPLLFYFSRPTVQRLNNEFALALNIKMYYLLWIPIPLLLALAIPQLRALMEVLAGVFTVQWGLTCWKLRKVGKPTEE